VPVGVENEFAEEEAEHREIEKKHKEQKEFGGLIVEAVQPFFGETMFWWVLRFQ
jgi:hypothetical protein